MTHTILVCCGTGCRASGSLKVEAALREAALKTSSGEEIKCVTKATGCSGLCELGPIVTLLPEGITYYKVKPADAQEILESARTGSPVRRLLLKTESGEQVLTQAENPFYAQQTKVALRNVGFIDPGSIDDYMVRGGYGALRKALGMTPEEIIREVERSGIRGRGGAGFPTGRKWRTAAGYDADPKYVVCNGDEGDPGAFMDCSILEGDPHAVLEGMAICALAIGAVDGYLYIRDEYDTAVMQVKQAILQAEERGVLGDSVLGSPHRLKLTVVRGGGAFVCGESTALMASIEGRVGEPRAKYIRSVQRGLWNQPTVLNNVETLANIPVIIDRGGAAFAALGTEGSTGTKVFALVGKVRRTGLVEVPMGTTLRHLIFDIGGGVAANRTFKAVQTGGPSGGCIPDSLLDLPVDFDTLASYGAMMGSGGMIVMDDRSCMVEVARYYVRFLCEESCGKCTPCREGLRRMSEILTDICEGRGQEGDIALLERIGATMLDTSLCGLGKSAPNPVLTTIRYFKKEYEAHIHEKRCPAGVCAKLTAFSVDESRCTGCAACQKACPAGAVNGGGKQIRTIDQSKCIACGSCRNACRYDAVQIAAKGGEPT